MLLLLGFVVLLVIRWRVIDLTCSVVSFLIRLAMIEKVQQMALRCTLAREVPALARVA